LVPNTYDYVTSTIDVTYTRLPENIWNHELGAPSEEMIDKINKSMIRLIQKEETIYESSYYVSLDGSNKNLDGSIYITNFLNGVKIYSFPQHAIIENTSLNSFFHYTVGLI
jgi:hypothetical protein